MKEEQIAIIQEAIEKAKKLHGDDDILFVNFAWVYLEDTMAKLKESFRLEEAKGIKVGHKTPNVPRENKITFDGFPDHSLTNSPNLKTDDPVVAEHWREQFPNTKVTIITK